MTRPWVAVEAAIRVNHKLVALPNDSARWGWVCILGEAKQQRPAGAFHSLAHLREAAGRFARFIPDYQREHLLETAPVLCDRCAKKWPKAEAGALVVHDWHVHQVDPGAAKRAKDWREGADRTGTERETNEIASFVDTDPSRALSLSMSTSLSETNPRDGYQVPGDPDEPYRTLEELTGNFPVQRVEANAIRTLDALCDRRGIPAVIDALRAEAPGIETQPPGPWQLIAAARNRLEPFASTKPAVAPKGMVQPIDEIRRQLDAR